MKRNSFASRLCVGLLLGVFSSSFAAVADMGDDIKLGNCTIIPGIELKGVHNSNVRAAPSGEQSDNSGILTPSLAVKEQSDTLRIDGMVWGRFERYSKLTEENHSDFGENLSLGLWNRQSALVKIDESYQNIQELDYSIGQIEARKLLNLGLSVGRDLTDKLQLDAGYKYDRTDYESPNNYDWSQNLVSLEAAHAMTEKSAVTLTGMIGKQESKGSTSDADFQEVLLGAKTRLTQKVNARAGLGWFGHDSGSKKISTVGYDAGLAWQATDKVLLNATANNTVEPATADRNNYVIVSRGLASGVWTLSESYSVSLTGMYIENDYDQDVVVDKVATQKKDHIASGALRLTYSAPAKFLKVFVEGKAESKDSTINTYDYDQTKATIGAMITY